MVLKNKQKVRSAVMQTKESAYKGEKSIVMESSELRAEFITFGGKMVSLLDKKSKREFLWQNTRTNKYNKAPYASNFGDGESSGFDEMFPTINECFYPDFPWKGIHMPDHGEVWALQWDYAIEDSSLSMNINGVRMPYFFTKKIFFLEENVIRIEYSVLNKSNFDMEFIWAAHPLFNLEEKAEIYVPTNVNEIFVTHSKSGRVGKYGDIHRWPHINMTNGNIYEANVMREKSEKHFEKYYFREKLNQGWSALKYRDNTAIALSFPVERVQYLGIWVNEGGFDNQYNIALEPCIGSLDQIDIAKINNKVGRLPAKSKYEWYLNLTVDKKERIDFVNEKGIIYGS